MTEQRKIHLCFTLVALGSVLWGTACSDTLATLSTPPPNPGETCEAVAEKRDDLCPEVQVPCEAKSTAECIFGTGDVAFESLCRVERTGDICQGADISPDYERWCAIQFCLGADFDQCLNDGLAQCVANPTCGNPPPTCLGTIINPDYEVWCASTCVANPTLCRNQADCAPDPGTVCEQIEALAGFCPNYGYPCPQRPAAEAECLLALLQSLSDPCLIFYDFSGLARCGVGSLSEYGVAMCSLEQCLSLWSFDTCNAAWASTCGFIIP